MPEKNIKQAGLFDFFKQNVSDFGELAKDIDISPEYHPYPIESPQIFTEDTHEPSEEPKIEEAPERKVLNEFISIMSTHEALSEAHPCHVDGSLEVLRYLNSFGYDQCSFELGMEFDPKKCRKEKTLGLEEEKGEPICPKRIGYYNINDLITGSFTHAMEKGYTRQRPIISLTHPSCSCSLLCVAPTDITQIPDTAPGLPLYGTSEEIDSYKEAILDTLTDVYVNRWTFLSDTLVNPSRSIITSHMLPERIKTAAENWEEEIRPIRISRDFVFLSLGKIVRPIPSSYVGFQIEKSKDKIKVYLINTNSIIEIPRELVKYVQLREIPKPSTITPNNAYVRVDDMLGMLLMKLDDNSALCYFPEFQATVFVDEWSSLEII